LCLASLVTGLIQSLGTSWGLFRHYWIVAKLAIGILATILLLVHTQPIAQLATVAAETTLSGGDLRRLRVQLVADAGVALLALLVATTLSVYKPRGLTPYGQRRLRDGSVASEPVARSQWTVYLLVAIISLVLLVVVLHLTGNGLHPH
jgi:hypothetical protein